MECPLILILKGLVGGQCKWSNNQEKELGRPQNEHLLDLCYSNNWLSFDCKFGSNGLNVALSNFDFVSNGKLKFLQSFRDIYIDKGRRVRIQLFVFGVAE